MTCSTALSWEEKNPKCWLYRPSEAMKRLRLELDGVKPCPFCDKPKKTEWLFAGLDFVVAVCPVAINPEQNASERDDCLIGFPHEHRKQNWLKNHRVKVETLLRGLAQARWGENVKVRFDWENRHYEHAHVQCYKK